MQPLDIPKKLHPAKLCLPLKCNLFENKRDEPKQNFR